MKICLIKSRKRNHSSNLTKYIIFWLTLLGNVGFPNHYIPGVLAAVWPDKTMWYGFEDSINPDVKTQVKTAIDYFNGASSCLQMKEGKHPTTNTRLLFSDKEACCFADTSGYNGTGDQIVNIESVGQCDSVETLRLIAFSAGLLYEQQRPDRDNFISIKAVPRDDEYKWTKATGSQAMTYGTSYDMESIMHSKSVERGKRVFAILVRNPEWVDPAEIGKVGLMSATDWFRLQMMYGCCTIGKPVPEARSIPNLSSGAIVKAGNGRRIHQRVPSPKRFKRGGAGPLTQIWKGGIVFYKFDGRIEQRERDTIMTAMKEIENVTCVQFQYGSTPEMHEHVYFTSVDAGCTSGVGRVGVLHSRTVINFDNSCFDHGVILHHLVAALGFYNENIRPDRDIWIDVLSEAVDPVEAKSLNKASRDDWESYGSAYDYGSIMHEPLHAHSLSFAITMKAKRNTNGAVIGEWKGLSPEDIYQILIKYECCGKIPPSVRSFHKGNPYHI